MKLRWFALLGVAALGCSEDEETAKAVAADTGAAEEADSGEPEEQPEDDGWLHAPDACEAPEALPDDPLLPIADREVEGQGHLLEVVYSEAQDRYYVAGIPGLTQWAYGERGLSETHRLEGISTRLDHVALVDESHVAISRRGDADRVGRVALIDTTDELTVVGSVQLEDAAGMAARDGRLYALSSQGTLSTYNVSHPGASHQPALMHTLEGLASPWSLAIEGDYAYIADNQLGLVVVDLTNPDAPVLVGPAEESEALQDVDVYGGHVYGAAGSKGVQIFSLEDAAHPTLAAEIEPGGAIISVSAGGDLLWTANQEGVAAIDIRLPSLPVLVGTESTPSWAMGVEATEAGVFLADWNRVATFEADPTVLAPDAQTDLSALYFPEGTTEQILTLRNGGSTTLDIAGLSRDIEDIDVTVDRLEVAPGESAEIRVRWEGQGDLSGSLCVATNDPDDPIQYLEILTSNDDSSVLIGEPAPDFVLPDTEGVYRTLSEQRGHPVVLVYFATW
jgi:hypothetical protein